MTADIYEGHNSPINYLCPSVYVGYSDKTMKLNPQQIEDGKFLTIKEIKRLTKRKNVTPHLAHSLETYLQYEKSK